MKRAWQRLAALGGLALLPALACTLNPQPLPPGETAADGGAGGGKTNNGADTDSSTAQPPPVTSPDAGDVFGGADGGVVRDASLGLDGDAGDEASDATAPDGDAPYDAPSKGDAHGD